MRHPDFDDRIVAFADMLHGRTELYDDNSHGTHVSSIIGGSGRMSGGRYEGMAPKCQLVVVKVLDEKGNGNIGNVLHGIQWDPVGAGKSGSFSNPHCKYFCGDIAECQ